MADSRRAEGCSVSFVIMTQKKFVRNEEDKLVAGVIAGLANYFNQDPVLFRIAAITFLLITGVFPGLIIYALAWWVVPRGTHFDYDIQD